MSSTPWPPTDPPPRLGPASTERRETRTDSSTLLGFFSLGAPVRRSGPRGRRRPIRAASPMARPVAVAVAATAAAATAAAAAVAAAELARYPRLLRQPVPRPLSPQDAPAPSGSGSPPAAPATRGTGGRGSGGTALPPRRRTQKGREISDFEELQQVGRRRWRDRRRPRRRRLRRRPNELLPRGGPRPGGTYVLRTDSPPPSPPSPPLSENPPSFRPTPDRLRPVDDGPERVVLPGPPVGAAGAVSGHGAAGGVGKRNRGREHPGVARSGAEGGKEKEPPSPTRPRSPPDGGDEDTEIRIPDERNFALIPWPRPLLTEPSGRLPLHPAPPRGCRRNCHPRRAQPLPAPSSPHDPPSPMTRTDPPPPHRRGEGLHDWIPVRNVRTLTAQIRTPEVRLATWLRRKLVIEPAVAARRRKRPDAMDHESGQVEGMM